MLIPALYDEKANEAQSGFNIYTHDFRNITFHDITNALA